MTRKVVPLKSQREISYSIKCVAVENERVFSDVYINQQNRHIDQSIEGSQFPLIYKRRRNTLVQRIEDGPDFLELNRRKPVRRGSLASPRIIRTSTRRTKSVGDKVQAFSYEDAAISTAKTVIKKPKVYPNPLPNPPAREEALLSSLVDQLLLDIYGMPSAGEKRRSESESTASSSLRMRPQHQYLQKTRLLLKSQHELQVLVSRLREHISHTGGLLVRQLRRKDYLMIKRDKQCDLITAHLQAYSAKRVEDTKMRFSLTPQPGESGFIQWLDAMKMVARLQGGIPPEFRKRLWLTLAERHLEQRGVDWKQAEKVCFNEWSNPDDEELGIQIVKDLHRTGCSLFCGAAGRDNQAVLRRVLLGFARWNKSVGYCQGLNVLAALVLQVVDRAESAAVKVMIYLIEGVLPEGYFADNLRGLSIDMAVFRDLLRARLPKLSKHLEALQSDAKDKATGSSYEPPLTNVFTMQWFLTLFCHCLPQEAVLRVWDLIFLEGDEILLRTALAIWEGFSDRIMSVTSADEFYSIMGVLTREMLEFTDTNYLIKNIVSMGPLEGVTDLREKHRYNITPWARKLSDDDDSDTEEDERLAVAAAMFSMAQRLKKERLPATMGALQAMAPSSDRERLALDISTLKQQYAKLRERQRQAHIILSAACARQSMVAPATSQAMNHLLVGKSALVSAKSRTLGLTSGTGSKGRPTNIHSPRSQGRRERQGVTLHWKDTKKKRAGDPNDLVEASGPSLEMPQESLELTSPKRGGADSDSDSTSTELCDEPDRLSDVDSEDLTSASESYVIATDDEKSSRLGGSPTPESADATGAPGECKDNKEKNAVLSGAKKFDSVLDDKKQKSTVAEISIAKITDQIRRLSAEDDNNALVPLASRFYGDEPIPDASTFVKGSSVETDLKTTDSTANYSSDISAIGKTMEIDDLDYSGVVSSVIPKKEDEVLVHEKYMFKEEEKKIAEETAIKEIEEVEKLRPKSVDPIREVLLDTKEINLAMDNSSTQFKFEVNEIVLNMKDTKETTEELVNINGTKIDAIEDKPEITETKIEMKETKFEPRDDTDDYFANIRRGSSILSDYSSLPLETSYAKSTITRDTIKDSSFETTLSFSSGISSMTRTYENPSDLDTLVSGASDPLKTDRLYYPKTYLMGHLPISPVTIDQKLSRLSQLSEDASSVSRITKIPCTEAEVTLANTTFSDRSLIVQTTAFSETKKSPRTPESTKSFSSGETMGPDSKPSSIIVSPRTPVRSESRDFVMDKSICSSISSDSKTLVLRSIDSDSGTKDNTLTDTKKPSYDRSSPSTPISTDSLRIKSDTSPKLVVSSSSDSCSPGKVKSSERSFSSDLQSPVSANSIKYTSSYNKRGQDTISGSPLDLSSATSPFYPIAHPNQKTPSPYSTTSKRRCSVDSLETSPEQKSTSSKESSKYLAYQSKLDSSLKPGSESNESNSSSISPRKSDSYIKTQMITSSKEDLSLSAIGSEEKTSFEPYQSSTNYYQKSKDFLDDNGDDPLSEKDTVPSLPKEKLDKHYLNYNYRHRDRSKQLERSSSSLERRFAELKSSVSTDEFATTIAKKRSSDILEDIKHLEAKAFSDGSSEPGMLTKKTCYMWEDLKNLEARRQDTFTDSASTFSKRRLEIPDISVTGEGRKSYIVHPRINIDQNSDSILNTIARNKDNGDAEDDGRVSKLGVWTKVKPRRKGNNGRRNSDRALKIIQENSAILHKILACQAKKRLPDLEEISKEITISPINEEISKIFSPILEKMGLNEHEINEELARINFKDFDNVTGTSVSEFDAKINDELSKLSLIDDNEQIDHFGVDEIMSREYLDTKEALLDRKINEELSKLLANYEASSPASIPNLDKGSSSQTVSEMEGLDISSISTNVFSYKSSNDSIDTRSELGSTHESVVSAEKYHPQFTENVLPYRLTKFDSQDLSPKSDIDIYQELEKLDKISCGQILPEDVLDRSKKELSPIQKYVSNSSPYSDISPLRYSSKPTAYDTSPLKTAYDTYKPFDFKSRLSPRNTPGNPYTTVPYEKTLSESTFDYLDHKSTLSTNTYEHLHTKSSPVLTKESLEFRVRYDDESPRQVGAEFTPRSSDRSSVNSSKANAYYSNGSTKPITPTKYLPKEERALNTSTATTFLDYSTESSDLLRRKYELLSPKDYAQGRPSEYDRHLGTIPSMEPSLEIGSYLTSRHRDYHPLSPNRQYSDQHFPSTINHYASKLSPGFGDESKRPVSHPEFPGKLSPGKHADILERGSSCYKKSSLSLGNIGHANKIVESEYIPGISPKAHFSPFPVRNSSRKPKELALKLGLYSPLSPEAPESKRS